MYLLLMSFQDLGIDNVRCEFVEIQYRRSNVCCDKENLN